MPDPILEEFCRAHALQDHSLRKFQRYVRDTVQGQLDERLSLIEENAGLTARVAELEGMLGAVEAKVAATVSQRRQAVRV